MSEITRALNINRSIISHHEDHLYWYYNSSRGQLFAPVCLTLCNEFHSPPVFQRTNVIRNSNTPTNCKPLHEIPLYSMQPSVRVLLTSFHKRARLQWVLNPFHWAS
ncbi:hypothetical protein TNCT_681661 [Trichonephila clavata]|uniref:Uncharacterized protein n=1 Tax=Trichonephila clavata TaxID=2740835 RepID=A0A8X6M6M1_TRICU|nr:hypothetical protein TNCT_681661 [Trichonephila clavata]